MTKGKKERFDDLMFGNPSDGELWEFIQSLLQQQREEILKELEMEKVTSVDVSQSESETLDGEVKWRKIRESRDAKYEWNEAVKELNAKIKKVRK